MVIIFIIIFVVVVVIVVIVIIIAIVQFGDSSSRSSNWRSLSVCRILRTKTLRKLQSVQ